MRWLNTQHKPPCGPVLQVVTSTDRRGAETFAVELGARLEHLGHSVTTMALTDGSGANTLDLPTLGEGALVPRTLAALRRASSRASVVIAHGSTTLPACALALSFGSVPFVYRNIGDPTFWSARLPARLRTMLWLRRSRAVVALTEESARVLTGQLRVPPRRVTVIPTGVSAEAHQPVTAEHRALARSAFGIPERAHVAAVVGALSPEKDVGLAIGAVARIPDLHLLVCGDGPDRVALEATANACAAERIHFIGALADPDPAFAAADLVVLSSRTEGLPAVLIEAGLRRLPVASCDVGYVRDIVADGVTGALSETRAASDLADAILRVTTLGREAGIEAQKHCLARFEIGTIAERWDQVLRRVAL